MAAEVWFFFPEERRAETHNTRLLVRNVCGEHGWRFQERPAKLIRTPNGGFVRLIETRDAIAVYWQMHRARTAILHIGEPKICVEPPQDRAVRRELTMPLAEYCQYKAFCVPWTVERETTSTWIESFETWLMTVHYLNERDPRCLPFPIFGSNWATALDKDEGRNTFERNHHARHRARGARQDLKGLVWELNNNIFHGHEQLQVAGYLLRAGFHWDVQNRKRRHVRLSTPSNVWKVRTYVNVYPDGTVRGKSPYAKLVR